VIGENVTVGAVREFWNANPLCAEAVPYAPGSAEFFAFYDRLREANEPPAFSLALHEYPRFLGKKVLDVGCGNGYVLGKYALEGARVTGIDLTETAVSISRKRFALAGLRGEFLVGNAETLPFGDETFDCACSMGVLHHTPDTARAVGEIHRVLKRDGRLIVMFYHRNSATYRLRMPLVRLLTGKSIRQQVNEVDGFGNPKGDVYTRSDLLELLAPFERIEMFAGLLTGEMILPRIGGFLFPRILLRLFERRFGWFLYAKAVKT